MIRKMEFEVELNGEFINTSLIKELDLLNLMVKVIRNGILLEEMYS